MVGNRTKLHILGVSLSVFHTEVRVKQALTVRDSGLLVGTSVGKIHLEWFPLPQVVGVAVNTRVDWKKLFMDRVFEAFK